MKKRLGIVSYNMYGNFTNYGSALQTYALHQAIDSVASEEVESVVVDYCPDCLADKDILNPMENMWDKDVEARERCRLSLPAIRDNYKKFLNFYRNHYRLSSQKYTSANFNQSTQVEDLVGYLCGSDTVFAVPEFGFDDGFYANYPIMKNRSVAYAASFGDWEIPQELLPELQSKLSNFKAIAIRENEKKALVESLYSGPVYKVIDPTLLLEPEHYQQLAIAPEIKKPYLLLYSRRGNDQMQSFAEISAKEKGWEVVEISLNARNADRNIMRYDAGVEEFLGLVKNASMVVTNSFHGMIFAILFKRPFYVFSRNLCSTKITELLELLGLSDRLVVSDSKLVETPIDYDEVHDKISAQRSNCINILKSEIEILIGNEQ